MSAAVKVECEVLSPEEAARLGECEDVLRRGFRTFLEVGSILLEIQEKRLYRGSHDNFGDYLREKWQQSVSHCYRLMHAVGVATDVAATGLPGPTTETQTRPLVPLDPGERQAAYTIAFGRAGGIPSERQVAEAAVEVNPEKARNRFAKTDDIGRARAKGIIPATSEVQITHCLPAEPEPEPEPEPAETDESWLASLPARASLAGYVRDRFDADALAYRGTLAFRDAYRKACKPVTNAAKSDGKGHIGPWMARHFNYFRVSDPSRWQACGDCKGKGKTLVGDCPACKGNGYQL